MWGALQHLHSYNKVSHYLCLRFWVTLPDLGRRSGSSSIKLNEQILRVIRASFSAAIRHTYMYLFHDVYSLLIRIKRICVKVLTI